MRRIREFFRHNRLAFLVTIATFVFFTASRIHAENYMDNSAVEDTTTAMTDQTLNGTGHIGFSLNGMFTQYTRYIAGAWPGVTITADAYRNNPKLVAEMNSNTAIAQIASLISTMDNNPPARTYAFVQDTAVSLGLRPQPVYAQAAGVGFTGMAPILPLWKAFRNMAYALLAIVMIIIGFMIMFRKKIDPKTVVTVQNAIPRIVVTLLLITFSYAIVGIMIDLMYLVMFLVIAAFGTTGIFSTSKFGCTTVSCQQAFHGSASAFQLFVSVFSGLKSLDDIYAFIIPWNISGAGALGQGSAGFGLLGALAGLLAGGTLASVGTVAAIGVALVPFLICLVLLFAFVRILFMLLNAYIQIILSLILGPLQILTDAFPGGTGFSSWFRNLAANIIVFPVTTALFILASGLASTSSNLWQPPYLQMAARTGSQGIVGIIGLGIIMSIPNLVGAVKESLKAKPAMDAGFGAIAGPIGQGVGTVWNLVYQGAMIKGMLGGGHTEKK